MKILLLDAGSFVSQEPRVAKLRPYGDRNGYGCALQAWTLFRNLVHRLLLQSYL